MCADSGRDQGKGVRPDAIVWLGPERGLRLDRVAAPGIEVCCEYLFELGREFEVLDDEAPSSVARASVPREAIVPEVFGADQNPDGVHDGIFRVKVPVPAHIVRVSNEVPDLDPRPREPGGESPRFITESTRGAPVKQNPNAQSA